MNDITRRYIEWHKSNRDAFAIPHEFFMAQSSIDWEEVAKACGVSISESITNSWQASISPASAKANQIGDKNDPKLRRGIVLDEYGKALK